MIAYASMGFRVFPCHASGPKAKAPLTPHGFKDATIDIGQIKAWHRQYLGCAWGVATTAERGVIDIDPRNGGTESLARLIAEHGALAKTPTVRTGSGGFHYWFRFPNGTGCAKVADGIDRKAIGGYAIVPRSKIDIPEHEGRAYAFVDGLRFWDVPIAEAPAWAIGTKTKPSATASTQAPAIDDPWIVKPACLDLLTHPGSPEGQRRRTLCQLVGGHLA